MATEKVNKEKREYDEAMMRRAIQLARNGAGHTKSNPMVGCVIASADGHIIGEGWHRKYGEGHAEVNAVNSVKPADRQLLENATVYVTLEPCSHYGKTPPCARLLTEVHPRRVVVGSLDPFPEVSGRGVKMLRDAGIEVEVGVLEDECRALNPRFLTAHALGRPYILLKWAESADGYIGSPFGTPRAILSTPITSRLVHQLRSQFDAIFVGTTTVITDNPTLDTRLWPGESPRPATFDSDHLPREAKLLQRNPILRQKDESIRPFLKRIYGDEKVTSLMVEGGSETLKEYLREGLFDEIRVETSPKTLLNGTPAPSLATFRGSLALINTEIVDGNVIRTYRRM